MAIRKVIHVGDPLLKKNNKKILSFSSNKTKKLVRDLTDTMRRLDLVGMAAPQIGENYQVFVTEPRKTKARKLAKGDELRIYINPEITYFSKSQSIIYEGCGCISGIFGPVKRPKIVEVQAYNQDGARFSLKSDGLLARVIQHEMDHLNGIEFIEVVDNYSRLLDMEHYVKRVRNSKSQLAACKITQIKYKLLD
jgi:peptide deformylase